MQFWENLKLMDSELAERKFNHMKSEVAEVRQLDTLGRVVLPKKMRTAIGISENDNLRISLEGNAIIIKRDQPLCALCRCDKDLIEVGNAHICSSCAKEIMEKF